MSMILHAGTSLPIRSQQRFPLRTEILDRLRSFHLVAKVQQSIRDGFGMLAVPERG